MDNIESMTLEQCRTAAQQLLDDTTADLAGDAAEYFEALTERAEQFRQQRDRSAELTRRFLAGELRSEGGSTGMHTVHGDAPGYAGDQDRAVQTRSLDGQRLAFTTTMAEAAAERMLTDHGMGQRALATSGTVVVGQEFQPDPVPLGRPVPSLIAALPTRHHVTPQFSTGFLLLASVFGALALLIALGGPAWLRCLALLGALGSLAAFALSRTIGLFGFTEHGLHPAPRALISVAAKRSLACWRRCP